MANQAETDLSLPTYSKGNTGHLQGEVEAGGLTSSQIQETWPWAHEKQGAGSKSPTSLGKPQGSFLSSQRSGWWWSEGEGKGFL